MALRRLFVLWLLIVAMPMQAFAASARLHCVAGQGPVVGKGHLAQEMAGGHRPHADPVVHKAHGQSLPVTVDVTSERARDVEPDRSADGRCSSCAMCHLGIALPAGSESRLQVPREQLARPDGFARVRSAVLPPLERPPRTTQL
jgi:hypothetical protein